MPYGEYNLPFKRYILYGKFNNGGFLVNRFQESMPQLAVNFHTCANNGMGLWVALT